MSRAWSGLTPARRREPWSRVLSAHAAQLLSPQSGVFASTTTCWPCRARSRRPAGRWS
ncbi:hypothetical protein ACRAWD_02175 [Caulobacter segnis]